MSLDRAIEAAAEALRKAHRSISIIPVTGYVGDAESARIAVEAAAPYLHGPHCESDGRRHEVNLDRAKEAATEALRQCEDWTYPPYWYATIAVEAAAPHIGDSEAEDLSEKLAAMRQRSERAEEERRLLVSENLLLQERAERAEAEVEHRDEQHHEH